MFSVLPQIEEDGELRRRFAVVVAQVDDIWQHQSPRCRPAAADTSRRTPCGKNAAHADVELSKPRSALLLRSPPSTGSASGLVQHGRIAHRRQCGWWRRPWQAQSPCMCLPLNYSPTPPAAITPCHVPTLAPTRSPRHLRTGCHEEANT